EDVDVVVFVVEGLRWSEDDELVLSKLRQVKAPIILAVNKVDELTDKEKLLPHLQTLAQKADFAAIVPISARKGTNADALEAEIAQRLPQSPPMFPEDQFTDRSARFLAAELVREQLMRALGAEVPYAT